MEFVPLASSSAGCCYLATCEGHRSLLLDAGASIGEIHEATGYRTSELAGALISHAHGDHVKAIPQLLECSVDCYASLNTWDRMKVSHHRAHVILNQHYPFCDGWLVRSFPVVHDIPTLGFLIEDPTGDRLVYLTDTAYSPVRFEGVNIFAVEANYSQDGLREGAASGAINTRRATRTIGNHMSLETCEAMLAANDLSRCREIWLLHLSSENSDAQEFRDRIERRFGIPTHIAQK